MPTREAESQGLGAAAKLVAERVSTIARLEAELAAMEIRDHLRRRRGAVSPLPDRLRVRNCCRRARDGDADVGRTADRGRDPVAAGRSVRRAGSPAVQEGHSAGSRAGDS